MECQLHEYHPALRELSEDEQDRVDSLSDEGDALIRELETELEDGTPEAEAASVRLADIERELDAIEAARTMVDRSEEHTSELQSLMRNSYAVFCLKKKKNKT